MGALGSKGWMKNVFPFCKPLMAKTHTDTVYMRIPNVQSTWDHTVIYAQKTSTCQAAGTCLVEA